MSLKKKWGPDKTELTPSGVKAKTSKVGDLRATIESSTNLGKQR
jgi:hypothetical protein